MADAKAKALPLILAALLLCGCTGRPLSRREIIRGVFFERSGGQYTACLLLEDKNLPEGEQGYKTAAAQGTTPAQALRSAESRLEGQPYYGLMDVAALPQATDWAMAAEIGALLYEKAQPSPEISLFALDTLPASALEWQADALYDGMQTAETSYGLHCGLQQLFVRSDVCILPVWRQDGYGMRLLPKDGEPLPLEESADAQLAAVLCGQSNTLDFTFGEKVAAFQAHARTTTEVSERGAVVRLHLTDASFALLTDAFPSEAQARTALCRRWQQTFALLAGQPGDPLRLDFWAACRFGPNARAADPGLQILFE